ncbi:50S ribosomal protein L16 [Candidatus Peribacteria bacterium RIFCSPLOWO2_12_FULL_55_15]|nr:MAG: 50S ribosomal protein L16 [Candidatus Peribacteria bacterium RIFCSPHIGHO2_01_FULL_54_22]OGJ63024.1 MAG: 50S ribosomal protein L16 [Candidatus Peribacteria bacterium RIFCSPHIGHO2_02_FULL_55_24]OGJ63928.1 MAG: 50S ribosomal protein L16 [Candidatus Peribacteria bacterium RIFCSPHIGHO2_12_FULL_54_10]OGJ68628.1 MAG: 50S ribosomal protein L16 [Candidatus Peribacteria bacterium RIFCSPLOWO2_01_FULL_54_110]OGJ68849.1 MAG: 50S ribosomal protein L16 [Candidatus Peribacteria bacterium RIFCSPLOWO2_02
MLEPKKIRRRKQHRLRSACRGKAQRGAQLSFGTFGLKAVSGGEVTARQIEAARKAITHKIQRGGKIWIRIFPHTPVTRKAAEVPMGQGKGTPEYYCANIQRGTVLFEMDGVVEGTAREALRLAGHKLPLQTKIVVRRSSTLARPESVT